MPMERWKKKKTLPSHHIDWITITAFGMTLAVVKQPIKQTNQTDAMVLKKL